MPAILSVLKSDRFLFLLIMTPFIYMTFAVLYHGVPDLPNSGDAALLELSTRNVFSRGILLGPYSRFPFFHPGPMYFQLRYPVYTLFGEKNASLLIATVLIQVLSLFFGWKAVNGLSRGSLTTMFTVSAALFLLSTDKSVWLSEWNPYIVVLPFMLYSVSMAAVASGRVNYLFAAVVSGSFAAQTHLSVIPSMALIGFLSMAILLYPRIVSSLKISMFQWKTLLFCMGILLVLWSAPLYQQFFPGEGEGNMTSIVNYFRAYSPDVNPQRAIAIWSESLTNMELGSIQAGETLRITVIMVRVLLLLASFAFLRKKGDKPFLACMALFCAALHGMSFLSVMQIRGELNDYLIQWAGVVPMLSLFVLLGTFTVIMGPGRERYLQRAGAAILVISAVALPIRSSDFFRAELHPSWEREIAVGELSDQLLNNLNWTGNTFYELNLVTTDQWPVMFGILNSLDKRDLPIGVVDNMLYVPVPVPEGNTSRILLIGTLNEAGMALPGMAARWNDVGLTLL